MSIYYILEQCISYFFEFIMVFVFIKSIFKIDSSKKYFIFSFSVLFLIFPIQFLIKDNTISSLLTYLLILVGEFIGPLLIKGVKKFYSFMTSLIYNVLIFFVTAMSSLLCSIFIKSVMHTAYSEYISWITIIIVSAIFLLLSTVWKSKTQFFVNSVSKLNTVLLAFFLFFGGALCFFTTVIENQVDYRVVYLKISTVLVSLIFAIVFPVLLYNHIKKSQYMYENKLYEQQLRSQLDYYQNIVSSSYELRKLRHDYNNLSIGIKELINGDKMKEILSLVNKYDKEIISSFNILYNTGCDVADAILTDKQQKVNDNIKIKFEGNLKNIRTNDIDIIVLLNNTLDIAIRLSQMCGFKPTKNNIYVKSVLKSGFLFYEITAPIGENSNKIQNELTKNDFDFITVKNLADKKDGVIKTNFSDNVFTLNIQYIY